VGPNRIRRPPPAAAAPRAPCASGAVPIRPPTTSAPIACDRIRTITSPPSSGRRRQIALLRRREFPFGQRGQCLAARMSAWLVPKILGALTLPAASTRHEKSTLPVNFRLREHRRIFARRRAFRLLRRSPVRAAAGYCMFAHVARRPTPSALFSDRTRAAHQDSSRPALLHPRPAASVACFHRPPAQPHPTADHSPAAPAQPVIAPPVSSTTDPDDRASARFFLQRLRRIDRRRPSLHQRRPVDQVSRRTSAAAFLRDRQP